MRLEAENQPFVRIVLGSGQRRADLRRVMRIVVDDGDAVLLEIVRNGCFARSGLADYSEHLTCVHLEVKILYYGTRGLIFKFET